MDADFSLVEIDIRPAQTTQLRSSQAGEDRR
jgi:hypothetical protein